MKLIDRAHVEESTNTTDRWIIVKDMTRFLFFLYLHHCSMLQGAAAQRQFLFKFRPREGSGGAWPNHVFLGINEVRATVGDDFSQGIAILVNVLLLVWHLLH